MCGQVYCLCKKCDGPRQVFERQIRPEKGFQIAMPSQLSRQNNIRNTSQSMQERADPWSSLAKGDEQPFRPHRKSS